MFPPNFEYAIAFLMVSIAIFGLAWVWRHHKERTDVRMRRMMRRVGLEPLFAFYGGSWSRAMAGDARWRCRHCPAEAECDRWLAGKECGDNSFCPNARIFRALEHTAGVHHSEH